MNFAQPDLYTAVHNLRANWEHWDILARAEAVMDLRTSRLSVATLARIAGCSTSSIRRLEVIGQLPPQLKARIRAGEPSGKFVAWARAARLSQALGIPPG